MSLTDAEIVETQNRLKEARSVYHRLQMGEQAVEFRDSDGSSVRYNSSNVSRLKAYIAELEGTLRGCESVRRNKLPLRPVWG